MAFIKKGLGSLSKDSGKFLMTFEPIYLVLWTGK